MTSQIDELIAEWGERLFYRPVQSRPTRKNNSGLLIAVAFAARNAKARAQRVRTLTSLTAKKVPEVMVKISGSSQGMNKVKAHLEYISRNGKVELENESGEKIDGRESVRDLCDEWKSGLYGIPSEGRKREAFNIVLSMPPGTSRAGVTAAAREFAKLQFGDNHQFVFAAHDDERHPHVHLCVKSLGFDGMRLNPRKADLQNWREQFAEQLRVHGIEANATPRFARGQARTPARQKDIHIAKRTGKVVGAPPRDIAHQAQRLRTATKAYEGLAQTLTRTGVTADRQLAVRIVQFVGDMHGLVMVRERQMPREDNVKDAPASSNQTKRRDQQGPEHE
ncbi:MAG: relaxase/mobilization nuclease domain-containing protein [Telluria sp.]